MGERIAALRVLGLEGQENPSPELIKQTFRARALQCHPDKNQQDPGKAEEEFKRLVAAYQYLLNAGVNGQHGTWVQDWSERDDLRMCEDLVQEFFAEAFAQDLPAFELLFIQSQLGASSPAAPSASSSTSNLSSSSSGAGVDGVEPGSQIWADDLLAGPEGGKEAMWRRIHEAVQRRARRRRGKRPSAAAALTGRYTGSRKEKWGLFWSLLSDLVSHSDTDFVRVPAEEGQQSDTMSSTQTSAGPSGNTFSAGSTSTGSTSDLTILGTDMDASSSGSSTGMRGQAAAQQSAVNGKQPTMVLAPRAKRRQQQQQQNLRDGLQGNQPVVPLQSESSSPAPSACASTSPSEWPPAPAMPLTPQGQQHSPEEARTHDSTGASAHPSQSPQPSPSSSGTEPGGQDKTEMPQVRQHTLQQQQQQQQAGQQQLVARHSGQALQQGQVNEQDKQEEPPGRLRTTWGFYWTWARRILLIKAILMLLRQ